VPNGITSQKTAFITKFRVLNDGTCTLRLTTFLDLDNRLEFKITRKQDIVETGSGLSSGQSMPTLQTFECRGES
jgi:hypothetical protein